MSIFGFVKKLNPRIERSTVAEDLRTTEKECTSICLPSWQAAGEHFKINKPGSSQMEELHSIFYRHYFDHRKGVKFPTFVLEISRALPTMAENNSLLQENLDSYLQKDIMSEGMSMRSAFVLRAASNISMVTRYLLSLLNYIYAVEAEHFDTKLEPALEISKAEMKYAEQNFARFAKLFAEYTMPSKDFKKLIDGTPEIAISAQTQAVVAGLYSDHNEQADAFEAYGVSGFVGNPIYRFRLLIARWQTDRYESAKAKKQQLELRLLYLQMQKDGTKDPIVPKEIERLQNRIETLDSYLRGVETDLDGDN